MEDEYDYFDDGFSDDEEGEALQPVSERVAPLGSFDQKGQANTHGRLVRVRRMSRRMMQRKPSIQSILITKTDGKQTLLVKAPEEGMTGGRG